MKRDHTKRVFPLLLTLLILFGLMPFTVLAEENDVTILGATIDTDDETYKNLNNAKAGLKALAALKGYPGAGAVVDGVFGAFFGTDTDRIQAALAKISQKLDEIKAQMADMTEYLDKKITISKLKDTIEKRITDYSSKVSVYKMRNETYQARLAELDIKDNETPDQRDERLKATRDFYLFTVNKEKIDGNDFHEAVRSLGDIIIKSDVVASDMDLFTAFDKLVLYTYNWEHHGYQARINFQSHVITLYTTLSATSMSGLIVGIADAEEEASKLPVGDKKRRELENDRANMQVRLDLLQKQIVKILDLAETHTINVRSNDERYYQVPGHEMLLEATAVPKTVNPTFPHMPNGWVMSYDLFGGVLCNGINKSDFYRKNNTNGYMPQPNDNMSAPYPSPEWLITVYKDYGGTKSLYEIFSSVDEGGFNINGIMGPNASFVTNSWQKLDISFLSYNAYYMQLVDSYGKNRNTWLADVSTHSSTMDGIKNWNPDMMIGLITIRILQAGPPSGDEVKITGFDDSYKAPYVNGIKLSVPEQGELCSYEWQVDKDGNGFLPIDGANTTSFAIGKVDDLMNGYQYRCKIINHVLDGEVEIITTEPVTLKLKIDNPKTGDNKPILFVFIALISVIGIFVVKKTKR